MGRKWTEEEKRFLANAIRNKTSLIDLSNELQRTPAAIVQCLYKLRLPRHTQFFRHNIAKLVLLKCIPDPDCFKPNRAFYNAVGMSQKRWWSVYSGEAQITPVEYRALCKYFNVSLQDAFDARQLEIQYEN